MPNNKQLLALPGPASLQPPKYHDTFLLPRLFVWITTHSSGQPGIAKMQIQTLHRCLDTYDLHTQRGAKPGPAVPRDWHCKTMQKDKYYQNRTRMHCEEYEERTLVL